MIQPYLQHNNDIHETCVFYVHINLNSTHVYPEIADMTFLLQKQMHVCMKHEANTGWSFRSYVDWFTRYDWSQMTDYST